jgi:colanic acid biosynthesis glycosyl transferase WcaI
MFASERAVIAMAQPGTELYEVVAPRGWVIPPGDAHALAQAIEHLADDASLRAELGRMGRAFAQAVLSRDAVLGEFSNALHARVPSKAKARRELENYGAPAVPVDIVDDGVAVAETDAVTTR